MFPTLFSSVEADTFYSLYITRSFNFPHENLQKKMQIKKNFNLFPHIADLNKQDDLNW
jgi:hypothetical protein